MDHCELHHREEVDGEFLEPRADSPAFLQPADRLLDDAAALVGLLVEDVSAHHGHPVRRLDRTDCQRLSRDWQPGVGRV